MEQVRRLHIPIQSANDNDGEAEARQEPKQFALLMFLDHPQAFNAASDMLSYTTLSSFSEFAGAEEVLTHASAIGRGHQNRVNRL